MGGHFLALVCILQVVSGSNLVPHQRDYHFSDYILRSVMDELSKELSVEDNGYLGTRAISPGLETIQTRVLTPLNTAGVNGAVSDMEGLNDNPSPSTGDQEYLQDSTLCANQWFKPDTHLPAYCNPPNPCPLGYTVEEGCMEDFENTAAFSRDFQHSQECMCDCEHMIQCSNSDHSSKNNDYNNNKFFDDVTEELSGKEHRNTWVTNKYHFEKNNNPFFVGDRLPVAAKKGIHLYGG